MMSHLSKRVASSTKLFGMSYFTVRAQATVRQSIEKKGMVQLSEGMPKAGKVETSPLVNLCKAGTEAKL